MAPVVSRYLMSQLLFSSLQFKFVEFHTQMMKKKKKKLQNKKKKKKKKKKKQKKKKSKYILHIYFAI